MDSDVYKWLEASARSGLQPRSGTGDMANHGIALVERRRADGYLNSYWQVVEPDTLGRPGPRPRTVLRRPSDPGGGGLSPRHRRPAAAGCGAALRRLHRLGLRPGKREGTPGHPEIELALVELYRETGERRYLDLAVYFVGQRGQGTCSTTASAERLPSGSRPGARGATVEGHAVRQLYLTAGVADLYLETGEEALLDALMRQWHDMAGRNLHHRRAGRTTGRSVRRRLRIAQRPRYCETCAQIAGIMWNWRMLLVTGERRYADLLERSLYNGFLSGVSLDGRRYFYVNPLLSRYRAAAPHTHLAPNGTAAPAPAQRDAPAGIAPALPCHRRRRRHPGPPVRPRHDPQHGGRCHGSSAYGERLPLGGHSQADAGRSGAWTLRLRVPAWAGVGSHRQWRGRIPR